MARELEKEFYSIDEAAQIIGWNRATVYEWVKALEIPTHKFVRNRRSYLAAADVQRLQEIKEKPWMAGKKEPDNP